MNNFKNYFLIEQAKRNIVLFPGSFKPPHQGHVQLIKEFKRLVGENGTVNVIVTEPSVKSRRYTPGGKYVPGTVAADILRYYIENIGLRNVNVTTANNAVGEVYDFVRDQAQPGDNIIVGVGGKGTDAARYSGINKNLPEGVNVNVEVVPVVMDKGEEVSASSFRNVLDNLTKENLIPFLPVELRKSPNVIDYTFKLLSNLPS